MAHVAARATTPAELHPAIRTVVRQAGDQHGGLMPPSRTSQGTSCRFADRAGQVYGGPLIPDVVTERDALDVALSAVGKT